MNAKRQLDLLLGVLVASVFVCIGCRRVSHEGDSQSAPETLEAADPQRATTEPVGVIGGQVRDSSGRAVPGARVTLLGDLDDEEVRLLERAFNEGTCISGYPEYMAEQAAVVASTRTDAGGGYLLVLRSRRRSVPF